MVLSEQVIGNILELNIPVLIGSTVSTSEPVKCVRCGDSIPPGQVNTIVIPSDLDSNAPKAYIGWPICSACYDYLLKRTTLLEAPTPEHPHDHFYWLDFLKVTLGVCVSEDHSDYDGADPNDLPSCPVCGSLVNPELGHLVLGISYKGLPRHNFGAGESTWTMIHWDCAKKFLEIDAKISFEYLNFFVDSMKREYSSSKESSDTTPKTDTDGVPK